MILMVSMISKKLKMNIKDKMLMLKPNQVDTSKLMIFHKKIKIIWTHLVYFLYLKNSQGITVLLINQYKNKKKNKLEKGLNIANKESNLKGVPKKNHKKENSIKKIKIWKEKIIKKNPIKIHLLISLILLIHIKDHFLLNKNQLMMKN